MDYKAKYEEALERAKRWADGTLQPERTTPQGVCEAIFPELAESEDERIRKHLIEVVELYWGKTNEPGKAEDLAWLERQKEMPTDEEMLRTFRTEYEKGVADTIAKYEQKEQKQIKWTDLTWKDIVELEGIINNVHYDFRNGIGQESFGKEVLERFRETKGEEYLDEREQQLMKESEQKPELVQHPPITYTYPSDASRDEQLKRALIALLNSDLIKVAGNKFTKQDFIDWVEKQKEQKPAEWSEEDNICWDEAFACVTRAEKAAKNEEELQNAVTAEKWLKEIKFKYCVHPVKQEWSEEDEKCLQEMIRHIEHCVAVYGAEQPEWQQWLNLLKSLSTKIK